MKSYLTGISNDLRISIPLSTSLIGIADPLGCLASDEISLILSDSEISGSPILRNIDVLVSRHPALRASDIQRVKAVNRPELQHLVDVVVFPVTGSFSLASKLQGGDYDGDTFWVCWDQRLVQDFRNAPPPAGPPRPEKFNITVDKTTCEHFMEWEDFAARFLRHNFSFQFQESLLGTCTNYHKRVRYTVNNLHDPGVEDLADIHDLLVDSSKNGYSFNSTAWSRWKLQNTRLRRVKEPFFEQAHGIKLDDDDKHSVWKNSQDIIDHLVFEIARKQCREMIEDVFRDAYQTTTTWDPDIVKLWATVQDQYRRDPQIIDVFQDLNKKLSKDSFFYDPWRHAAAKMHALDHDAFTTEESKNNIWDWARQECRKRLREIEPYLPYNEVSRAWRLKTASYATSTWEYIKASALFNEWHEKPDFVFSMAGEVLCSMKSMSLRGTESVIAPILQRTKIRKRKLAEVDYEEVAEAADEDAVSDTEMDFYTARDPDEVLLEGDDAMSLLPDVPRDSAAAAGKESDQPSTQYSWPVVPSQDPTQADSLTQYDTASQEQADLSRLSAGYSQLSV